MTKPTLPFTQTREQAKKAIINLLKNADSFIKDASEKYEKKQLEHITIPITFAMEQLGQSKLIFLKLNSTQGDITFEKSDKMFDHQENIDRIKSELEISEDKVKEPINFSLSIEYFWKLFSIVNNANSVGSSK